MFFFAANFPDPAVGGFPVLCHCFDNGADGGPDAIHGLGCAGALAEILPDDIEENAIDVVLFLVVGGVANADWLGVMVA